MASLIFENVCIQYPIYNSRGMSLRNQLVRLGTGGRIENESASVKVVTALQNANFTLTKGDRVGLVGHNGAGKSTLLRAMAGIYHPVSGQVRRKGKVATVLELGAGMDPELSGYENITRMGILMGMSHAEIDQKVPEIESFTELGDFLQLPVRTYSAGMATRLMFAVATSVQPDILLVDEVFGTGDADFQAKAKTRMEKLIQSVGIFVFASHDHQTLKQYCHRVFKLEHGQISEISKSDL
jgi:lipopolysaccharide transport system ATP-binding protein